MYKIYKNVLPIKIGLICGPGFYNPKMLFEPKEVKLTTPYGNPSDILLEGSVQEYTCVLLARNSRRGDLSPCSINYRANIWALKEVGCSHIIAIYDCASLTKGIRRNEFVVPHDIINLSLTRTQTFYDGAKNSPPGVMNMTMSPPFSEHFRTVLIELIKSLAIPVHDDAIIISTEGPRFATRAECKAMQEWGGEIFSPYAMPEAVLAKELGLLYVAIAAVTHHENYNETDYAFEKVNMHKLKNSYCQRLQAILNRFVANISRHDWDSDIYRAKEQVFTNFSPENY